MLSWISTYVLSCLGLVMMVMMMMMMMMMTVRVEGFPSGAPNFACNSMRPTHPQKSQPEKTFPVHVVLSPATIWPGDIVDVKVVAREPSFKFLGMLTTVHEVVPDIRGNSRPTLLPGFTLTNSTHFKLINCVGRSGGSQTGLTHVHKLQTDRASFRWTVPDTALVGTTYALRFTIVENFVTYWVAVNTTFTIATETVFNKRTTTVGTVFSKLTASPTPTSAKHTDSGNQHERSARRNVSTDRPTTERPAQ
ncbi:hypothetical protein ACOMHN_015715 [Nucella lapillus]